MISRDSLLFICVAMSATLFASIASAEAPARRRPSQINATGAEDAVKVISPVEAAGAADLDAMTSRSTEGLKAVKAADGSLTLDLEGRFMHVLVAKPGVDGTMDASCHTGHDAKREITKAGKARKQNRAGKARRVAAPVIAGPARTAPEEMETCALMAPPA